MTPTDQRRKAQALLDLHSTGRLLVLPNVWDPLGARILESKGFPAVATASSAIASSLGYVDGERLTRETMLATVSRICRAVDVPVTADMESGYGESVRELEATIGGLIDTGAVGVNLEDSIEVGGPLRPQSQQAERIARTRDCAAGRGIHLVINARVDSFLSNDFSAHEDRLDDAVARADAYAQAGADCIYPIGPGDEETLTLLRRRISSPLNILATPRAVPLDVMAKIGVNRVSFGPYIFRSCLRRFVDIAASLASPGSYDCFGRETISEADVAAYLRAERELEEPPGRSRSS